MKGEAKKFRENLTAWFRREGRDYPWRRTRDPYAILVSEFMLQQTQIATVLGPKRYYERWLEQFPDVETLAAAPEDAVLKAWEGLGYYSRARNLHQAARAVVSGRFSGEFPRSAEAIRSLPGVGRYTAGAVASFAFDLPEPVVDANVARVLARLFFFRDEVDSDAGQKQLWTWAAALMPKRSGRIYNSALMELGQRICTPKDPACDCCPVGQFCRARGSRPELLPVKKPRPRTALVDEHVLWAERDGTLLLARENEGQRRKGLWKLPERRREEVAALGLALKMTYSIMHYRVTLRVYAARNAAETVAGEQWVPWAEVESVAMASPYRKAILRIRDRETGELEMGRGLV